MNLYNLIEIITKKYPIKFPYLTEEEILHKKPLVKLDICSKYISSIDKVAHHSLSLTIQVSGLQQILIRKKAKKLKNFFLMME